MVKPSTATGVTTGIHQRTAPGTTLSWDVSADMPVGENQLEWSMTGAGLVIPGWSWSTTGDLEIIDDSLILTRSGSSRVYGTIILQLPIEAAPSYHTFFEQSSQSSDHLLQCISTTDD